MAKQESKKKRILTQLFEECRKKNDFVFANDDVRKHSPPRTNQFDVTKIDTTKKLPKILTENDYAVIHLGEGCHKFIKGINKVYHNFEPIRAEDTVEWKYRKSILNLFNTSESNILSVANNQRILHHFLFEQDTELNDVDIIKRPKTYFPHRTKTTFEYFCGEEKIVAEKQQIEIDLTIEFRGTIGIFEAKNGKPSDFAICQIYHPFLYYHNANLQESSIQGRIKEIYAVYMVREPAHKNLSVTLNFWKYTFENPYDMTSIKCLKSAKYFLIRQRNDQ